MQKIISKEMWERYDKWREGTRVELLELQNAALEACEKNGLPTKRDGIWFITVTSPWCYATYSYDCIKDIWTSTGNRAYFEHGIDKLIARALKKPVARRA